MGALWLILKPILTGALAFLRGIDWRIWAGLGILALGLLYGHGRYNAGQANVQTKFDAYKAEMIAKTAAAKTAAQRAETAQAGAIAQALADYKKGKSDAKGKGAAVTVGVKSGSIRLRDHWACPGLPKAAADPGPDPADLRAESAGRIVAAGADADAQVTYLQGLIKSAPQCFTVAK